MRCRLFVTLFIFGLFFSSQCYGSVYTDHDKLYSIEFPEGWNIEDKDSETYEWVTAQSPPQNHQDGYLESIQITYSLKKSSTSIDQYLPEVLRFMKEKYHAASIVEISALKMDGQEAKKILFTAIGPGIKGEQIPLRALHYILVHDQHLMIILCVSSNRDFEKWKPTFEKSIQSLKFLK